MSRTNQSNASKQMRGNPRLGFTLLETIVVSLTLMASLAMLLPLLQSARESSRRQTCKDNLKQIGLAIHHYHTAHQAMPMHGTGPTNESRDDCCGAAIRAGRSPQAPAYSRHQLSYLVGCLPFIEQQEIWEQISQPHEDSNGNHWPAFGPAPYAADYAPWNTEIPTLRCPSDPFRGGPSLGRTNYAACVGDSAWRTDNASWSYFRGSGWRYDGSNRLRRQQVEGSVRGAFVPRRQMKFRDILDGLANTLLAGEIATGNSDGDVRTTASIHNGRANVLGNPKFCEDDEQMDPRRPRFWSSEKGALKLGSNLGQRGFRWADFRPLYTQINTILPPNSEVCLRGTVGQDGILPPSSRHPGGAHVLMCDGAVIFMTESVECGDSREPVVYYRNKLHQHQTENVSPYGLWGALGTRSARELIDSG